MSFRNHVTLQALVALLLGGWVALPASASASTGVDTTGVVMLVRVEDQAITPVTEQFIDRMLTKAEDTSARCLILTLDTPGGLLESTRQIVKRIMSSNVPVVVYVSPTGARAASAGLFITLSAHVAAMAPGTHIGAAHPVQMGGLPGSPQEQPGADTTGARETTVMEEKVLNDAVAWVRSIADIRGRNADWSELAVTESRSITEKQALDLNVIDLVAANLDDLLRQLDGREVEVSSGQATIMTEGAVVVEEEMWWGEKLLGIVSNPNIAFLLIIFGFYGILFELYSPGWGVGGTIGIVCLITGFFALAVLPVNYTGLALIILALGMFVAEVFVTSFGALTMGGVICLILGGVMLIDSPFGFMRVSLAVVVPVALATAAITFFLLSRIVKTHRSKVQTGIESMLGSVAIATENFAVDSGRYSGFVRIHGELWKAYAGRPVAEGDRVRVQKSSGLSLIVEPSAPEAGIS